MKLSFVPVQLYAVLERIVKELKSESHEKVVPYGQRGCLIGPEVI